MAGDTDIDVIFSCNSQCYFEMDAEDSEESDYESVV
jgi:hypothetical protein